jgi:poly-gamma-glutamate synthesis protein (capsule biosynthesis protein)
MRSTLPVGAAAVVIAAAAVTGCGGVRPAARPAPTTPAATAPAPTAAPPPAEAAAPAAPTAPATPPAPPAPPSAGAPPAKPPADTIVLVAVGDVGLNRTNLAVDPGGVLEGGKVTPWGEMTAGIAPLIKGDLNFMNLETVVTARNDLPVGNKGQEAPFFFRSHPAGVRHVAQLGFNLFSAANNHAYDYGEAGVRETVANLDQLTKEGLIHAAGIGLDRDHASRPAELDVAGAHVAFSAIGNVTNMNNAHRAGEHKPGTMGYRHDEDWELVTSRLAATPADLRILSIHYGTERDIRADDRQRREYRQAAGERGADVVLGHHAHVVRGVELHQGKPIFYGLGNFLIRGAADISTRPDQHVCCDFGLLARVYFRREPGAGGAPHLAARALEVVPITAMNRAPEPLPPAEGARRVAVLNVLAESLDDTAAGSKGVRFAVRDDGSGLFCADGAGADPGPVGALCATYHGPTPATAEARERVRAAPDPSRPAKPAKATKTATKTAKTTKAAAKKQGPELAQREKAGKKRRPRQK